MPAGQLVTPRVVSHPPCHFRKGCSYSEYMRVAVDTDQAAGDAITQMTDHSLIQTSTPCHPVRVAKCVHGGHVIACGRRHFTFGQDLLGLPGAGGKPKQTARNMQSIGDILEERQPLDPTFSIHVVIESPLCDADHFGNPASADASVIQ
ncbi:hypothetical protein GCM10010357_66830 [Streptomyces luteireticuli]|uniref:Uncharacterized protein n=1 Tax=Streptomyces luteireticuli TaxID=173858 RepID=A0ABP3J2N9_9ACTN